MRSPSLRGWKLTPSLLSSWRFPTCLTSQCLWWMSVWRRSYLRKLARKKEIGLCWVSRQGGPTTVWPRTMKQDAWVELGVSVQTSDSHWRERIRPPSTRATLSQSKYSGSTSYLSISPSRSFLGLRSSIHANRTSACTDCLLKLSSTSGPKKGLGGAQNSLFDI